MREESASWWQQAIEDLHTAEMLAEAGRHYACAFFCQQAAEKAVKALFIERQRQPAPPTHTLPTLGQAVGASSPLMSALRRLNLAYVTTRYPDAANGIPAQMYDEETSTMHLADARQVVAWVREHLEWETG